MSDGLIHHTYNTFGMGDNLIHLQFLRRMSAKYPDHQFIHACGHGGNPAWDFPQLQETVEDIPQIEVVKFSAREGIDSWRFLPDFKQRRDFCGHYIERFRDIARQMGLESATNCTDDMIFDSPSIKKPTPLSKEWDFLVVNVKPCAGQFDVAKTVDDYLDPLIQRIVASGKTVCCVNPTKHGVPATTDLGISVSGIGNIACSSKHIVMIAVGCSWLTYNPWAKPETRIILIDDFEEIWIDPKAIHAHSLDDAIKVLEQAALI